jgi:zinc protease
MKKLLGVLLVGFVLMASPVWASDWQVEEVTSPSGIKAWLVRDEKLPLVTMKFAWKGGVEQDPADRQGLSRLMADLLTEGAGSYDALAFQKALVDQSIQMGFAANRDIFSGSLKTLLETKDQAFDLLRLALSEPRFDPADMDRAKERQKAAVRAMLGHAEWQARYALFGAIYRDHPYAYRSLGTEASLDRISRDDLRRFAAGHLAKENLIIAAAGSIQPDEFGRLLDRAFGALPQKAVLAPMPLLVWPEQSDTLLLRREGTQTNVLWAMPGPKRTDPDWYAAEIANYILGGGGFSSRLMQAVRDEKGLTYGVSTVLAPTDCMGSIFGSMATDNGKTAEALELVKKVWKTFYQKGPTSDEMAQAKAYLKGSLPLALNSTDTIAGLLVQMQLHGLGPHYLTQRETALDRVSVEDVRRVLARWFDPDHAFFAMVGNPKDIDSVDTQELVKE